MTQQCFKSIMPYMAAHILYIIPDVKAGHLLETRLLVEGLKVTSVRTVEKAISVVKEDAPEMILWDCGVFDRAVSGELTRLRGFTGGRVPILLLSALVSSQYEKEAIGSGAAEIFLRTMDIDQLCKRIKDMLMRFAVSPGPVAEEGRGKKILIVDDEEDIRELLRDFFTNKGFTILEAGDGPEALEIVQKEIPAVVLLDVQMPEMSGIEVLKRIKQKFPQIGVVMATAISDEGTTREAIRLGAYSYILKPFDLSYLEMVVLTRLMTASN